MIKRSNMNALITRLTALVILCCTFGTAYAQFAAGQILTAGQLNSAFANTLSLAGGTLTGPLTVPSLNVTTPIAVASGGTGATTLSAAVATAAGGSTARSLAAHFSDVVNVRDRGVKCDGTTDDTAAINALAPTTVTKTKFLFPAGVCIFTGTISFNLNGSAIVGAGSLATQFIYTGTSTTRDLLDIFNAYNPLLQGFTVWSSTTMTAGSAIHLQKAALGWIKDVQAARYTTTVNTLWNGLWIDQPGGVWLDGFLFESQNDALAISALGVGTNYQYDVFGVNGRLDGSAVGLHVGGGVDNVHFDKTEVTSNTINVLDDNSIAAFKNQEIFLGRDFVTDQGQQYNYYINDSLCNLANYGIVSIAGPVTHAVTNDGIMVNSFPGCQLHIDSPFVTNNNRDGIRIVDASALVSIAPSTLVQYNGAYGINSISAFSNLVSMGATVGNAAGALAATVTPPSINGYNITASGSLTGASGRFSSAGSSITLNDSGNSVGADFKYQLGGTNTFEIKAYPSGSLNIGRYVSGSFVDNPVSVANSTGVVSFVDGITVSGKAVLPNLSGTTASIGGSALTAGACTSGTVAVTGSTTAMAVQATPATYPGDGIFWHGYVSAAGTVTVKVCASVAATPTSSAYNVRVLQ